MTTNEGARQDLIALPQRRLPGKRCGLFWDLNERVGSAPSFSHVVARCSLTLRARTLAGRFGAKM